MKDSKFQYLILLLWLVEIALGDEYYEDTNPAELYIPIFDNIPTFFEYLLETLEERPEVLENNDAKVFKRDTNCKQGVNKDCEGDKQLETNKICYDVNEVNNRDDDYYDDTYTTVLHEYGNSNKEINKRGLEQENGSTRQANESRSKGEDNIEYEFDKDDISNTDLGEVDFDNINFGEHKFKRSVGIAGSITPKKFKLTAEEVVKKTLEVEKMLENYEAKNKKH